MKVEEVKGKRRELRYELIHIWDLVKGGRGRSSVHDVHDELKVRGN